MSTEPKQVSTGDAIAAIVEPIRACGVLLGFAVGFLATYRSGGDLAAATLHGLLGAVLLWPLAWFLGLFLVRESIKSSVEEQRAAYEAQVADARRQVAERLGSTPGALGDAGETLRLPPGGGR